jgi:hypothetical protein
VTSPAEPNADPDRVTLVPTDPIDGTTLARVGGIEKYQELLGVPSTITHTGPEVADAGTRMVMDVSVHAMAAPASTPLKYTVLEL